MVKRVLFFILVFVSVFYVSSYAEPTQVNSDEFFDKLLEKKLKQDTFYYNMLSTSNLNLYDDNDSSIYLYLTDDELSEIKSNHNKCFSVFLPVIDNSLIEYNYKRTLDDTIEVILNNSEISKFILHSEYFKYFSNLIKELDKKRVCLDYKKFSRLFSILEQVEKYNLENNSFVDSVKHTNYDIIDGYVFLTMSKNQYQYFKRLLNYMHEFNYLSYIYLKEYNEQLLK